MTSHIHPNHDAKRRRLTILGTVLIIAGIGLGVVGAFLFSQPFATSSKDFFNNPHEIMDRDRKTSVSGLWLSSAGGFCLVGGIGLVVFAQRGRIFRYSAAEVAPVAKDTIHYLARETKEAVRDIGATLAKNPSSTQVVKVRCRHCSYLEREEAKFCSACGQSL